MFSVFGPPICPAVHGAAVLVRIEHRHRPVVNLAVWQCLLESLDAFVGDFRVSEAQRFEVRQAFQVDQPGVGYLRVGEAQRS